MSRSGFALPLNDVAYAFPAGHRLRLGISTSYWPLAWLPPEPARLTLSTGGSRLVLPVRQARAEDAGVRFEPPEVAEPLSVSVLATGEHTWVVERDLATDTSTLTVVNDNGRICLDDIGLEVEEGVRERYSTVADDFSSARGEVESVRGLARGDWSVRTVTRTTLTCDVTSFHLHARLDAFEGPERVFSRNWSERIPRRLL